MNVNEIIMNKRIERGKIWDLLTHYARERQSGASIYARQNKS